MKSDSRLILAGALTNFAMGLLYCWTLFAAPIAAELNVSAADIGAVPAVSLVAFTFGVNLGPAFVKRLSPLQFIVVVFLGSAAGIALVAFGSSIPAVALGFGGLFGIASGLGYGHALRMAQAVSPAAKGIAVGICVTAFALTAIVLAFLADSVIRSLGVQLFFVILSALIMAISVVVWRLSKDARLVPTAVAHDIGDIPQGRSEFLLLMFAFFSMCFVGLAVMANTSIILRDFGVSAMGAARGIAVFNVSYVIGSLFGGRIAETLGGRTTIIAILAAQALALVWLLLAPDPLGVWALAIVSGVALGATASVFPVHLAQRFGSGNSSRLFARLVISYGAAGFIAPWLSMLLRNITGGYDHFLIVSLAVTLAAISPLVFRTRK